MEPVPNLRLRLSVVLGRDVQGFESQGAILVELLEELERIRREDADGG